MNIQSFNLRSGIGYPNLSEFRFTPEQLSQLSAVKPQATTPVIATKPSRPIDPMVDITQPDAPRTNAETLQTFGGDRQTAIGTLIASGAEAENPDVGFFGDVVRKIFGGSKTSSRQISPNQTIATKVKVKNFNLKELRLTTTSDGVTRHIDFSNQSPAGGTAEVKDIGQVIGAGQVERMFEQEVGVASDGRREITNNYFDPKTGQNFLRTTEVSKKTETTKLGTIKSKKKKSTDRFIEVLGKDGKVDRRYSFDYGSKRVRLENLDDYGNVTSSYKLSKKTDFFDLVDRLSNNPPSERQAVTPKFPSSIGSLGQQGFGSLTVIQ